MESRKMVLMNLYAGKEQRHRHREQTCGQRGGRRGWSHQDSDIATHTCSSVQFSLSVMSDSL